MATAKASIGGHPIHPAMVSVPIGLWTGAILADLAFIVFSQDQIWVQISFCAASSGVLFAVAAGIFGFVDYLGITNNKTKTIATFHMILNLAAIVIFGFSAYLLHDMASAKTLGSSPVVPFILQFVGFFGVGLSSYIGGELVFKHHMAVQENKVSKI